jgi:hypothetical protein
LEIRWGKGMTQFLTVSSVDQLLTLSEPMRGDANFDGTVDVEDLAMLADHYNLGGYKTWAMGDFDRDGDTDLTDLTLLATYYQGGEAQAFADFDSLVGVPEPTAAGGLIFTASALMTAARRRRRSRPRAA